MGFPKSAAPPPVQVTPPEGSRLEQLMVMLPDAEAAEAEAKQRVSEIRAGIQDEAARLATAANGGAIPYGIRIAGVLGLAARVMRWHGSETTFNAAAFENDYPGVLDDPRYRKPKKPYWKMDKEGS
jgi:hypothetical protein